MHSRKQLIFYSSNIFKMYIDFPKMLKILSAYVLRNLWTDITYDISTATRDNHVKTKNKENII